MVLSYAVNIQHKLWICFSFQKSNLSICRIVLIYDCAVYDGKGRSFRQFSLIFLRDITGCAVAPALL